MRANFYKIHRSKVAQVLPLVITHSGEDLLDFEAVLLRCLPPFRVRFLFTSKWVLRELWMGEVVVDIEV